MEQLGCIDMNIRSCDFSELNWNAWQETKSVIDKAGARL